jgi:hypothetical protein
LVLPVPEHLGVLRETFCFSKTFLFEKIRSPTPATVPWRCGFLKIAVGQQAGFPLWLRVFSYFSRFALLKRWSDPGAVTSRVICMAL